MKKILSILCLSIVVLTSCRDDEPDPNPTEVKATFNFTTSYNGEEIGQYSQNYTNVHGETFSFIVLKYYVTDIVLVDEDGVEHPTDIYKLVDAFDPNFQSTTANIPVKKYTDIRFYFGVPDPQNQTAAHSGDLNIANGMAWSWDFGYIFFKHEGQFSSPTQTNEGLSYHIGTDIARKSVSVPFNKEINTGNYTVTIDLDLYDLYNDTGAVEFSTEPTNHSTDPGDQLWVEAYAAKIASGFSAH